MGTKTNLKRFPVTTQVFCEAVKMAAPGFMFTSITVTSEVQTEPHVDVATLVFHVVIPLSGFGQGDVWVAAAKGPVQQGASQAGVLLSLRKGPIAFFACDHVRATEPWARMRVVLVAYCVEQFSHLQP